MTGQTHNMAVSSKVETIVCRVQVGIEKDNDFANDKIKTASGAPNMMSWCLGSNMLTDVDYI